MRAQTMVASVGLFTLTCLGGVASGDHATEPFEREALCRVASDEANVYLALDKATPGQFLPAPNNDPPVLDVCIRSGGTVTIVSLDLFILHNPVSTHDVLRAEACFNFERDAGHWMTFRERDPLTFRYDAAARLVAVSLDGGLAWRACPTAATELTPERAVIPWFSYLHTEANGVIVVEAGAAP